MAKKKARKKNEGEFVCVCLWTGTLSFSAAELKKLGGNMRAFMGPCPECGKNSLAMAQEPLPGAKTIDDLFDEMEAAALADQHAVNEEDEEHG